MKQSSFSNFMESFRHWLIKEQEDELVYNYEKADVKVGNLHKKPGEGCDLAKIKTNELKLILVECKTRGKLDLREFKRGRKQLEDSADFIYRAFGITPNIAIICHGGFESAAAIYLRYMLNTGYTKLRHDVKLILYKSEARMECSYCRLVE